MDLKLVVVGGDMRPSEITVQLPLVLGRGRDAEISLPHTLVSRRHCELYASKNGVRVRDLGSLNGTYIGHERVEEADLAPGDLLTVGTVTFRALYGEMLLNKQDLAGTESDKNNAMRFIPDDDSTIFSKDDKTDAAGPSTVGGEFIEPLQLHQSDDHTHDI